MAAAEERRALLGSGDPLARLRERESRDGLLGSAAAATASLQRTRQLMTQACAWSCSHALLNSDLTCAAGLLNRTAAAPVSLQHLCQYTAQAHHGCTGCVSSALELQFINLAAPRPHGRPPACTACLYSASMLEALPGACLKCISRILRWRRCVRAVPRQSRQPRRMARRSCQCTSTRMHPEAYADRPETINPKFPRNSDHLRPRCRSWSTRRRRWRRWARATPRWPRRPRSTARSARACRARTSCWGACAAPACWTPPRSGAASRCLPWCGCRPFGHFAAQHALQDRACPAVVAKNRMVPCKLLSYSRYQ